MVVGGRGALGSLLCRNLRASGVAKVYSLDLRAGDGAPGVEALVGDVCALDAASSTILARCDLVILAIPADAAARCVPRVAEALGEGAVIVETLSVKSRVHAQLAASSPRVRYLGINPMFAPDLGFSGRPVLVVGGEGPDASRISALLEEWGAEVVALDADGHDRALAALQVVTHASVLGFGLALHALDYRLDALAAIAPPPHRAMIALLARIASNDPEVYRDIQADNPYAAMARRALADGLSRLEDAAPSADAFAALMTDVRALLGSDTERLNEACVRMFAALGRD
jgi:4-amino-4-deoxyprephenate dehydrogenase